MYKPPKLEQPIYILCLIKVAVFFCRWSAKGGLVITRLTELSGKSASRFNESPTYAAPNCVV